MHSLLINDGFRLSYFFQCNTVPFQHAAILEYCINRYNNINVITYNLAGQVIFTTFKKFKKVVSLHSLSMVLLQFPANFMENDLVE